jgi:hypothetical protein
MFNNLVMQAAGLLRIAFLDNTRVKFDFRPLQLEVKEHPRAEH